MRSATLESIHSLSSNSDDTSTDEALNLCLDGWVLHVLLESGRVVLRLLEDGLHDWVLHNTLDLKVC